VTGLVLAVFIGTMAGVLLPAAEADAGSPAAVALGNVLRDDQLPGGNQHCAVKIPSGPGMNCPPGKTVGSAGMPPQAAARFLSQLRAIPGTTVYPIYHTPLALGVDAGDVVSCAVIRDLAVVGQCPAGARAVLTDTSSLLDNDNPRYIFKPIAGPDVPAYTGRLSALPLVAVLVRAGSPATLERARTFLATHTAPSVPGQDGNLPTPPRTIAETVAIRIGDDTIAQRLIDAAVTLTLIMAGCSLAVAVGGGLVDRKRPFTLLRVSGVPVSALSRVVLMEAALPLAATTVIAAGIAYGTSVLAVSRLAAEGVAVPGLGRVYYETLGAGLAAALLIILLTLPLLRRMSAPGNIRFE
jgi:FtsX-like permease family protein